MKSGQKGTQRSANSTRERGKKFKAFTDEKVRHPEPHAAQLRTSS